MLPRKQLYSFSKFSYISGKLDAISFGKVLLLCLDFPAPRCILHKLVHPEGYIDSLIFPSEFLNFAPVSWDAFSRNNGLNFLIMKDWLLLFFNDFLWLAINWMLSPKTFHKQNHFDEGFTKVVICLHLSAPSYWMVHTNVLMLIKKLIFLINTNWGGLKEFNNNKF